MKLIIPHSLLKSEFLPYKNTFSLEVLKSAAKKALSGMGIAIKGSKLQKTKLRKLNLTSPSGAGRVLFLLQIKGQENAILLILRAKNDKQIGENMSTNNKKFNTVLHKNTDLMLEDLHKKNTMSTS
jgi:hypothetical protein